MNPVDDPSAQPSLVDDPDFLSRLGELDAGLGGNAPPARVRTDRPGRSGRAENPPAGARSKTPEIAPAPDSGPAPGPSDTPSGRPAVRRPLLELFPPALLEPEHGPPLPGTAEGPNLPPRRQVPRHEPVQPQIAAPAYETFYGLTEPPFDLSTDPKFLYASASHERVAQRLLTAIRRREGFVLVTGAPGVGKTTACRAVIEQTDRRTLTSLLTDAFGSIEDLLQTVLVDVGVISRDDLARAPATRDALMTTLRSFLASLAAVQATALVLIDDAHRLPDEVLAQLPLLAGPDGVPGVLQLVIVGKPSLRRRLRRRALRVLDRSFAVRCAIEPLAPNEVLGYVVHRLSVAGGNSRVEFDEAAGHRLHQLSGGVQRTINVLCERALTLGCAALARVIDVRLVDTAADELGVIPPIARSQIILRGVAMALALCALTLVGAAGALWVFHEPAERAAVQWAQVPRSPAGPTVDFPTPLTPILAPDEAPTPTAPTNKF